MELELRELGSVLFCHATPRSDTENLTRSTPDAEVSAALSGIEADVVVGGHTHVQQDRPLSGGPRLVNAGSVGLPYQGEHGAFWALLGPDLELRRTPYDIDAALESLAELRISLGSRDLRRPGARLWPSAESATAFFAAKRGGG